MFITNNPALCLKLLFLFVLFGSQTFVACQTKGESAAQAIEKCRQLLDKDDLNGARQCINNVIVTHPQDLPYILETNKTLFYNKCKELHDEKKDYKNAIICFEGVTALYPDEAIVFIYLADAYYKYYTQTDKDPLFLTNGEKAIKRAIEIEPEDALAHSIYGRILYLRRDLSGALKQQRRAVELEPNVPLYRLALAIVQENSNDPIGALESYQTALKIDPNHINALYLLQQFYVRRNKLDEAIETLERLIRLKSENQKEVEKELKRLKAKREFERTPKQSSPGKPNSGGSLNPPF